MPGFKLHPLKGDSVGFRAVTVRAKGADLTNVDVIDCHWSRREMTTMKHPPYLGLTVKPRLPPGVTRQALNNIVSSKSGVSSKTAVLTAARRL